MSPVAKKSERWCGLRVGSLECVSLLWLQPQYFWSRGNDEVGGVAGTREMAGPNNASPSNHRPTSCTPATNHRVSENFLLESRSRSCISSDPHYYALQPLPLPRRRGTLPAEPCLISQRPPFRVCRVLLLPRHATARATLSSQALSPLNLQ
jgi:hypothetical protein